MKLIMRGLMILIIMEIMIAWKIVMYTKNRKKKEKRRRKGIKKKCRT